MTISNQYQLEQEAKSIAKMAMAEQREYGTDAADYIHQVCDGHESVIYTYKAGLLCLECDRDNAEDHLEEVDYQAASYADYVTRLAYAILFDACMTAFYELPQDEEEEEEISAELETGDCPALRKKPKIILKLNLKARSLKPTLPNVFQSN